MNYLIGELLPLPYQKNVKDFSDNETIESSNTLF
jgi:hypothetical protein